MVRQQTGRPLGGNGVDLLDVSAGGGQSDDLAQPVLAEQVGEVGVQGRQTGAGQPSWNGPRTVSFACAATAVSSAS